VCATSLVGHFKISIDPPRANLFQWGRWFRAPETEILREGLASLRRFRRAASIAQVLAYGGIPDALLDVVKNGASGSTDSFRQFAPIRLAYRRFV
jgi:hypothetical protein